MSWLSLIRMGRSAHAHMARAGRRAYAGRPYVVRRCRDRRLNAELLWSLTEGQSVGSAPRNRSLRRRSCCSSAEHHPPRRRT